MKKIIALLTLVGLTCIAAPQTKTDLTLITPTISNAAHVGTMTICGDEYTCEQVSDTVGDALNQWGASGYATATNVTVLANTWTDVPGSFVIPYARGFDYISDSTIVYTNGTRQFLFLGNASLVAGSVGSLIEIGLETNGVYVVGSTSGQRKFQNTTDAGSVSYNRALNVNSNDTVGLVIRSPTGQTITINTWQSTAIRF